MVKVEEIENVNSEVFVANMNSAGATVGMQPLPPGTPVSKAAVAYSNFLAGQLTKNWASIFPKGNLNSQTDSGYMQPFDDSIIGTTPECVVNQFMEQMDNWGLPTIEDMATKAARTITNELIMSAGATHFVHGTYEASSNESIDWMAGFGTFRLTTNELGVVYCWGAGLEF